MMGYSDVIRGLHGLPTEIIYHGILPRTPCLGITPGMVQRQLYCNRAVSVVRRNIGMSEDEHRRFARFVMGFAFDRHKHLEYFSERLILTIFYRNPMRDDYVVIYLA